jgi:hypothetical protein
MSDKMTCPGCNSYTSSILLAFEDERPCPHCGLSAEATTELLAVREKVANDELKAKLTAALLRADKAERRVYRLEDALREIKGNLEGLDV